MSEIDSYRSLVAAMVEMGLLIMMVRPGGLVNSKLQELGRGQHHPMANTLTV